MALALGGGMNLGNGEMEVAMYRQSMFVVLGLMAGLTLGCEKKESPPAAPSGDAGDSAVNEAASQAADAQQAVEPQIETAATEVADTVEPIADEAAVRVAAVKEDVETTIETAAADATIAKAQLLIDEAMNYIKENKLDLAENALEQLDKISGSLPASIQSQIVNAQKALDAAKASGSLGDAELPDK